jgi:ornithine lipid ester-linked acyl 2-hydroxylase
MRKLWFSLYDFSFEYKGDEPSFIENENFAWANDFKNHYNDILTELKSYLKENELEGYFNTSMVSKPKSWKTISLKNWGIQLFKNQKKFPITTSIISKYPEILSFSFNLLEAKSSILPHCGDTNGIYRCHFGLEIPESLPNCGFRVRDELRSWENGQWLIFMDAYHHEAFNHTDKSRYILVIDVLRPEFKSRKNKIIATVRTSLFLQKRAQTMKFLLKMPKFFIYSLAFILSPFALIATKVFNLLKIY